MSRHLHLVSFALVCLGVTDAMAQRGSSFVSVSLLPADAPMDEYSITGDGNRVYYSSIKGDIMLYDRKASKTTRISDGGDIWDVTVSKSGSAVAFTKTGEDGKDEFIWTIPLDPATGLAKGPQRRASMMPGDTPSLSHDGRLLAFARDDSIGQSLVVLPTLGGPERVLASFSFVVGAIQWTPDGKTLFFSLNPRLQDPLGKSSIQRISVQGGAPKFVTATRNGWPGLSPDGSMIAYVDSGSFRSIAIADTTGRRLGSFTPPVGFSVDTWNGTMIVASRNRNPFREHIYSLVDGTSRVVTDTIDHASWPLWSPNGKQISFATHGGAATDLVVADRDGSSGHSIRLERQFGHNFGWSPDGRWILYSTSGLPTTAVAVDLTTGKQVPLATSYRDIPQSWTADSRLLLALAVLNGGTRGLSLREFDLTGGSKELLQISADQGYHIFPVDEKSALVRRGADRPMVLESLTGGPTVQILPPLPGFSSGPILSPSGQWVAFRRNPQTNDNTRFSILDVARMDGSKHTSIEMPFPIAPGAAGFLPGDEQLIISERPSTTTKPGVYLVTIATHEIKKLFEIHTIKNRYVEVSLSPDGKSILYTNRDSLPPGYASLDVSRFITSKR